MARSDRVMALNVRTSRHRAAWAGLSSCAQWQAGWMVQAAASAGWPRCANLATHLPVLLWMGRQELLQLVWRREVQRACETQQKHEGRSMKDGRLAGAPCWCDRLVQAKRQVAVRGHIASDMLRRCAPGRWPPLCSYS